MQQRLQDPKYDTDKAEQNKRTTQHIRQISKYHIDEAEQF